MRYINMADAYNGIETIDQFATYREAREMIKEYRMAFGQGVRVWISQRSTKEWREND